MAQNRLLKRWLARLAAVVLFLTGCCAHAQTGVTADSIIIGQSAPLSGAAAELGQQLSLGARLYFNAVNAAGGIHGRKIDFRVLDDGFDAEATARNTRALVNNAKAFALFGFVGTQSSLAALKVANPAGVPFFAPYAGAQSLREPFARNVFHVRAGFNDETAAIVQQIKIMGRKRIGVIYNDDAYGRSGLDGLQHALALPANAGLGLVGQASVARYTTNVRAALSSVLAHKPEVIVVVCGYQTVAALVSEAHVQGYAGQFYNLSLVGSKMQTKELGTTGSGVVISQVMPYPRSVSMPIVREYQKLLKANGITEFDYCSLEGYIAARVFVEGLRRAGRDLTRDKFIQAIETLSHYDMGGFVLNFSPSNHLGSSFVEMTIVNVRGQVIR
ncbi:MULTISPECIES: ABC transporter substrate-binding protein [Ralstonia solanacearum species complex]|uniref:ABC transporter substrate-binding protein n=1 Tax=Ralstonia solanacearum species complex TaxID=3116862 RepID=UPI00078E4969|nr:ABC transporter substrate-binding protein [Ralstonia solanacearum]BEU74900.1 ABC transporter substrate-binding protein [Ralstonia pseudosolanacearum]AMP40281.1 ABC transporter permease [Ralstonia solanacearum]AXV79705.1 ABC transporter permease [Ralstonia solanacearum]AXV89137.1 ABC transporter permease [Ralstonia solanacearum]AXV93732.1 ABC transporter permease [Ralstonia solanacearum]